MTSVFDRRSLSVFLLCIASMAAPARAGILFYNGDNDGRTSLLNETNVPATNTTTAPVQNSLVYDNFIVPTGQTWTITSVFTNDLLAYVAAPTKATWQIRSGVSAGSGGTLVASGDTAATLTALSSTITGYTADQVSASVPSLKLTAGTYWLAVAPDSGGYYGDQAYVMTTGGANSVGSPAGNDGNSYITNSYPTTGASSYYFTASTTVLNKRGTSYGANIDFSMGVVGTSAATVPEPSSLVLLAVGLIGTLSWSSRRRSLAAR